MGETKDPAARLFAQFNAPQTKRTKKSLIAEVIKENSRVRVLFATSAFLQRILRDVKSWSIFPLQYILTFAYLSGT